MEFVILPGTEISVSRLGVGGCPLGGHGWGHTDEDRLLASLDRALEQGLNFFDTADVYGLGQSEGLLGGALRGRRHRAVIATKCGVRVENGHTFYDNSPEWIQYACEQSLRRLKTDYIDLYQLHYRDGRPLEAVLEVFSDLRRQGKIRYFGISNVGPADLRDVDGFVSLQNPYSLTDRAGEAFLLEWAASGRIPITWGSLGQGILTGKYGPASRFGSDDRRSREIYRNFHGEKLRKNLEIVEAMKPIAREHGVRLGAVAVRFILDRIPGSIALCGVKAPDQLLTDALGWQLTHREIQILDDISAEKEGKNLEK